MFIYNRKLTNPMKNNISTKLFLALFILMFAVSFVASAPTVGTVTPSDGTIDTDGDVDFSAVVTLPDTGETVSTCTLNFPSTNPGDSSYSMTVTNSTNTTYSCDVSLTSIPEQSYTYTITASNGTTASDDTSAETSFQVDINSGGGGYNPLPGTGGQGDLGTKTFWAVAVIGILLFAVLRNK